MLESSAFVAGAVAFAAVIFPEVTLVKCAHADEVRVAERPDYQAGDMFEYVDRFQTVRCRKWEVKGRDAKGYGLFQCEGNVAYFSPETGALVRILGRDGKTLVSFDPSAPPFPYPLRIGKTWSGSFKLSTAEDSFSTDVTQDCAVTAYEQVHVVAGDFQAFRMECETNWSVGPFQGEGTMTMWYAPQARALVKAVNDSDDKWNMELARYRLAAPETKAADAHVRGGAEK